MKPLTRHIIPVVISLAVVLTALILGYRYARATVTESFKMVSCTTNSVQTESENDLYRCVFQVQMPSQNETTAYRYGLNIFNQTLSEANECKNTTMYPVAKETSCYLPPNQSEDYVISLDPAFSETDQTWVRFVNLVLSFLAVFLISTLTMMLLWKKRFDSVEEQILTSREEDAEDPVDTAQPKGSYSKEEVRAIVRAHNIGKDELPEDFACCICLEETGERFVRLDCNHFFHYMCIKVWLRRGAHTCPLCNAQIPLQTPTESVEEYTQNGENGQTSSSELPADAPPDTPVRT